VADGTDTSTLTMTAKDAFGNVITGIASNLTLEIKDSEGAAPAVDSVTLTTLVEDVSTPGIYTATLKGKMEGVYTVKPLFNYGEIDSLSASVTLLSHDPDGAHSTLTADPASVAADGIAISTLTFTARDLSDNAVTGIESALAFEVKGSEGNIPTVQQVTVSSVTETGTAGVYTATLKGTLADSYTVVPLNKGGAIGELNAAVTLTAGALDGTTTQFGLSPDTIVADNSDNSTLTLVAKDKFGNRISGLTNITMTVKDSQNETPSGTQVNISGVSESTTTPGTYTATLKGTLAGTYTVTPQSAGSDIKDGTDAPLSKMVTLIVGEPDGEVSTFVTSPKSVAADNTETSTFTLKVADAFGNPVSGLVPTGLLSIQVKDSSGKTPKTGTYTRSALTEDAATPGTYTGTIKSSLVDTLTLNVMYNSDPLGDLSDTVEFKAGAFGDITANGKPFSVTSGFPTTGFVAATHVKGAKFTLNMPAGKTASDYDWVSSQSWVTVGTDGLVTFSGNATSATKTVKITATPKSGGLSYAYTFTVSSWYTFRVPDGKTAETWSQGNTACLSAGGAMPTLTQLTSGPNVRQVGSLWGEWGNLIADPSWVFGTPAEAWYKSSTPGNAGTHYIVAATGVGYAGGTSQMFGDNENTSVGNACFVSL
ncbi:invasin domain 3-containing protein, partial [Citrobacter amalonaticus]|uniref:invasin domain 3-containing protein n=1 Tax=Citrobacter amalonaticus TaxID=35703 RepID=UPI00207D0F35